MTIQMAIAGETGASGQGKCDGCGGSGDDVAGALTCAPMLNCTGMAAVLPVERVPVGIQAVDVFIPVSSVARDLIAPPDTDPPKPSGLD